MLNTLKFVQGAVARKDFVPALVHFKIENGFIKGFDGKLSLCSPIDLDLNVSPLAVPFIKAITTCRETVSMHLTDSGRLAIKSGSFKAYIDCMDDAAYPDVEPEGDRIELDGEFIPALKMLNPFIAEDASRPWARGILFFNDVAFATNNIVLMEYTLDYKFPVPVNIPKTAVRELIRIGIEPEYLQVSENSVTFHYPEGRWLRTALYDLQWPDLTALLNQDATYSPMPEGFVDALESLTHFVDDMGRVHFLQGKIATHEDEGIGASVDFNVADDGCFNHKQLLLIQGLATEIDFSAYPKPCLFKGDGIRGAIVGLRS